MSPKLVLPLPARSTSPAVARQLSGRALAEDGATDGALAGAVALIVSELVSNAVRHAVGPIRLELDVRQERVVIEVFDGDSTTSSVVAQSTGDRRTSGRGLLIVSELSDSWGVREAASGKAVWASLDRRVPA